MPAIIYAHQRPSRLFTHSICCYIGFIVKAHFSSAPSASPPATATAAEAIYFTILSPCFSRSASPSHAKPPPSGHDAQFAAILALRAISHGPKAPQDKPLAFILIRRLHFAGVLSHESLVSAVYFITGAIFTFSKSASASPHTRLTSYAFLAYITFLEYDVRVFAFHRYYYAR